jgi:imidazolonepropionase-like amidohydrolase
MVTRKVFLTTICLGLAVFATRAQVTLLTDAEIHLGNGTRMPSGQLAFDATGILWVGSMQDTYSGKADTLINLSGKKIYPGIIAPATAAGLVEIEAVRATVDFRETGDINPNVRAGVAFNTDSRVFPTLLYNGIAIVQTTPEGGLISGQSAVMRLGINNWEDAAILMDDGIHINWPRPMRFDYKKGRLVVNKEYENQVRKIEEVVMAAKAYQGSQKKPVNLKLEAFSGCFDGTKRVYFHADLAMQIHAVLELVSKATIKFPVLVGGYEAPLAAKALNEANMPVILQRVHELPGKADEPVDHAYTLPKRLYDAGVPFCISNIGRMPVMGNRNIPFMAGTAVGHGLPYDVAVQAITQNAAIILGIDNRYGTLEAGKSATFIICGGDLLDATTQDVSAVVMDGQFLSMANWQRDLYNRYMEKYFSKPTEN